MRRCRPSSIRSKHARRHKCTEREKRRAAVSGHPQGAAVAAPTKPADRRLRTSALALLSLALFCGDARSDADDSPKDGVTVEEARVRFNYVDQKGFGYQSQAGPGPAGSERLRVYEPMFYVRIRQNPKVEHAITVPIDVITSASTDSVDAISSASRNNEAASLNVDTRVKITDDASSTSSSPVASMTNGMNRRRKGAGRR